MATDSQILRQILSAVQLLSRKADIIMSQQDDLDAVTTEIESEVSRLQAASQAIKDELAALEAQVAAGQPVSLDALKAAVAGLDSATADVENDAAPPA